MSEKIKSMTRHNIQYTFHDDIYRFIEQLKQINMGKLTVQKRLKIRENLKTLQRART